MNEKEFFKPFRKYELDYKRLKRWYLASLYSYDSNAKIIKEDMSGNGKRFNRIYYKESHMIESNLHNLEKNIGKIM